MIVSKLRVVPGLVPVSYEDDAGVEREIDTRVVPSPSGSGFVNETNVFTTRFRESLAGYDPFAPETELTYSETLHQGDELTFYIRVKASAATPNADYEQTIVATAYEV